VNSNMAEERVLALVSSLQLQFSCTESTLGERGWNTLMEHKNGTRKGRGAVLL
jgi:hypothetical protein